jgi:cytochrome c peroxidase
MNSSWEEIIPKLKKNSEYQAIFDRLYKDGITEDNIKNAIVTFEHSLVTPNSRFDKFLMGDKNALNSEEKQGYDLFKEYGCVSCHQGVNIGGNLFQNFGVIGDYFKDRGNLTKADLGLFNVTGKEEDCYFFKVPSLRNISLTPPYFHDGSAKTLEQAVRVMGKYQLGRQLSQNDTDLIIKFLNTLNGEYQGKGL